MLSKYPSDFWVVIPAFNEVVSIGDVVHQVSQYASSIVVVDDGSTDNTAACALNSGAIVLKHPINLGQGAAIQTGITYALNQGANLIGTFDADGQHQADDIGKLFDALVSNKADVAIGSRFLGSAPGISRHRRILLQLAVWYTFATTGLRLTDSHNGIRLFTRSAACKIRITQNQMAHASQILEIIAKLKLRLIEVPVTIRYTEYSKGKGQRTSDAFKVLIDLMVGRFHK